MSEKPQSQNFLQGQWLGHPLHPILVHLPIGFFVLTFFFDVLSYLTELPAMAPGAFYAIMLGVFTGLVASFPGMSDYSSIRRDAPAKKRARLHMVLNLSALLLYMVSLTMRSPELQADPSPAAAVLLALIALGLLSWSGKIGGDLVYNHGVGVGRHRRKMPLPKQTVVCKGDEWEFLAVADAKAVQPGQTLRAEINGAVVAVANVNGAFFAFQEFCPHRYGPLSEGTVENGRIVCPWHNSCFDVRSGEVAEGPAKNGIKVFPVRLKDGKIEVQVRESNGNEQEGKQNTP